MGRPRKYDWDDKREICSKLWNEDKLSATQIVKWFADHFQLPESELPGPNQFHHKFREWGFPSRRQKHAAIGEDEALLARMRELFAQNMPAMDIQKMLKDEGWMMDNYHFRKFRRKHGMLMRNQHGYKPLPNMKKYQQEQREREAPVGHETEQGADQMDENEDNEVAEPAPLSPEEIARRTQRLADLQLQSDEALRTRKRRRRIRGYGHLPPDQPNLAPRYGSETSLDECKAYLGLDNDMYLQVRSEYNTICRQMGIIKMTECADGQWQASKDRLVRENAHLSAMLHPLQPDLDLRQNALQCICSDVTKRMRHEARSISIADANNILGLDPVQSKHVRRVFYEILEADHFTTAVACGKEHLTELRDQWMAKCDDLRQALESGDDRKRRAVDVLDRDARKRYGDDLTKKNPDMKQWMKGNHYGPGPGPAQGRPASKKKKPTTTPASAPAPEPTPPRTERTATVPGVPNHPGVLIGPGWFGGRPVPDFAPTPTTNSDSNHTTTSSLPFNLDPLLSQTDHGPPWPPQSAPPAGGPAGAAVSAYFRLAPTSQVIGSHPRMWLGKLTPSATFEALHRAATAKVGGNARVAKVNGIVKNVDDGSEDSWVIENDEELGVYLGEAGEKATFVVVLEGGYA